MRRVCACGTVHSSWAALPFVGVQFADVPGEELSLRNCPACGSTMAVPAAEDPATAPTLRPDVADAWFAKADAILAEYLGRELLS